MSQWCDKCYKEPYVGCSTDCWVLGLHSEELAKKYLSVTTNLFDALQLLRKEVGGKFSDWKDADDWLFSELNMTKTEINEVYRGREELVYVESAVDK